QELKAMGPDKEIVIYEGLAHPVLCRKIRYYKDSYFTKRLLDKVDVQVLDLGGSAPGKNRTAGIIAASTLALLSACAGPQVREEAETAAAAPPPIEEIDLYGPSPADIADEQAAIAVDQMIDAMPRSAFKSVP